MKILIALILGLGTPLSSWADSECIRSLENADSVLNRAATLETQISEICKAPVPDQVVASCGFIIKRLSRVLECCWEKPRAAEAAIEKLVYETEKLNQFLAAYQLAPRALATYLMAPQFLQEDVPYLTKDGTTVQFSRSILSELIENDRLAPVALRAVDHGHLIRLTQDSEVVEVRIRAREFGNARLYGLLSSGGIWLDQLILNHMRAHDIPAVVRRLKRTGSSHSKR